MGDGGWNQQECWEWDQKDTSVRHPVEERLRGNLFSPALRTSVHRDHRGCRTLSWTDFRSSTTPQRKILEDLSVL